MVSFCFLSFSYSFAQSQQITNGLNYLLSIQNPDGSWGTDVSGTEIIPATASTIETLQALNQTNIPNYSGALSWLQSQGLDTTDYLSERIHALSVSGADSNLLISYIDQLAYAWGGYDDFDANNLDTSLALVALKKINYSDQNTISYALGFLTSTQNPDGGWGFYQGDDSNVYMTAVVFSTLQQFTQSTSTATASNRATSYLIAHQNSDGGFGSSPSTVYETSLAYIALVSVITDNTVLGNAINYLTLTQSTDGSWLQDPFSTALALRALYYAENRPAPPPTLTTGTLTGKVTNAANGETLAGVAVSLSGNPALTTLTDSTGVFKLADVTQGSQQITLVLNGYATATVTTTVTAGTIVNLGILPLSTTSTTGIIQGVVTDATTRSPLAGVIITVTGGSTWTAVTAADGDYRIADVTPGMVTISAAKAGYPALTGTGTVTAGGVIVFSPALSVTPPTAPTGALRGSVFDAVSGLPIAGATVTLTNTRSSYTTTSTVDGKFSILYMEPGEYLIRLTASGYYGRSGNITAMVYAGSVTDLGRGGLYPAPSATTIRGKVTDSATGALLANATISVTRTDFMTKTDISGAYVISGINLLEFEVKASASGFDSRAYFIKSPYHDDLTVDFNLDPSSWSHVGIVSLTTARESYPAYADVAITVEVLNTDLLPMNATVSVSIMNPQGEVVDVLRGTVLDADGIAQSNITFQPGIVKTINIAWGTGYYPPGVYSILVEVKEDTPAAGLVVVAQRTQSITIEPTQAITSLVLTPLPRFTNLGANEQIGLQTSLVNHSNVPTEITFGYTWKSPSGLLLRTGNGTISAQPTEIAKSFLVETFPFTFTESGDHYLQVQIISGPSPADLLAGAVSVAPGIRIEASQSLTPTSVIPDGDQRIRVNIKLKGVEQK